MNQKLWDNSVHGTTVFWLVIFFIGLFAFDSDIFGYDEPIVAIPEEWEDPWEIISWIIWIVFVVDLFFKYRQSENIKVFFKKHWFDIILLIPFFRIFMVFRLLRLLKTLKLSRIGLKAVKTSMPILESGNEIRQLVMLLKKFFKKKQSK